MVHAARATGARDQAAKAQAEGALRDALGELLGLDCRLIARVVNRATPEEFRRDGEIRKDLRQEGERAYWRAVELYDPERGTAFSTLVWTTIYRSVRRWIEDHAYSIRVPGAQQRRLRQVLWHRDKLRAVLGREPSTAELAAATGLSLEQVRHLAHIPRVAVSLDDDTDDDGPDIAETVADDEAETSSPLVYLSRGRVLELLHIALDGDSAGILIDYYGLREGGAVSPAVIAKSRGLQAAEVRARIRAAVETLAQPHYQEIARAWATEINEERADEQASMSAVQATIAAAGVARAIQTPTLARRPRPPIRSGKPAAHQYRLI